MKENVSTRFLKTHINLPKTDPDYWRRRLMLTLLPVMALCLLFFSVVDIVLFDLPLVSMITFVAFVATTSLFMYFRKSANVNLSARLTVTILVAVLLLIIFHLSPNYQIVFWMVLLPPFAFFMLGRKAGYVVSLIFGALIAIYHILYHDHWDSDILGLEGIVNFSIAYLGLVFIIGFFERSRREAFNALQSDMEKQKRMDAELSAKAAELREILNDYELNQSRLKLAVEGANEGLWDYDVPTGKVFYSDTWCRMLGYEPDELAQFLVTWERLIHPEDSAFVGEAVKRFMNNETEFYECTHRLKTKDGNWKWIYARGSANVRGEDSKPVRVLGIHMDVSKQKETEQKLKESVRNQQKLFSIIAHDLRSPLGSFKNILEMLTDGYVKDEETKTMFLNELRVSSDKILGLLDNILLWSRSQANAIAIRPVHLNVRSFFIENIDLYSSMIKLKSIDVKNNVDEACEVNCDPDSLNLVIRNLLTNAIKFTPDYGAITISSAVSEEWMEIEVSDSGAGMEESRVNSLFNTVYYNGSTPGTRNEPGSGLGLILCKDFVERNGGTISVKSIPGKGSRFTFTLPLAKKIK